MSRRKIPIQIYITPEQKIALDRLHEATRVPKSTFIRDAIDLILERESSAKTKPWRKGPLNGQRDDRKTTGSDNPPAI